MLKRQPNSTNVILDGLVISEEHLRLLVRWASVSRTIQHANGLLVDFDHVLAAIPEEVAASEQLSLDVDFVRDNLDEVLDEMTALRAPLDALSMQIKNWFNGLSAEEQAELPRMPVL